MNLLVFEERYFEYIWGGRKLETLYEKPLPAGKRIGEAWLVSDHPRCESVVADGPYRGRTLRDLLAEDARTVLGRRAKLTVHGRFPLLLKLLDAAENLSVQVHPDDETARRLNEPDVGKTESWHVLQADPGAVLYCGMDPAVDRSAFKTAIEKGETVNLLAKFPATAGTTVFVPAGTVHAIGKGAFLAEIQQNSDITYRVYDWGRVGPDGKPRELHVEKALEATHFGSRHRGPSKPLSISDATWMRTVLAACRYFAAERVEARGRYERETWGDSFHILLGTEGELVVHAGDDERPIGPGRAVLVTGGAEQFAVTGDGAFLEYYVPDLRRDVFGPLQAAGHAVSVIIALGGDAGQSDLAGIA